MRGLFMKKYKVVLSLLLVMILALTGCGNKGETKSASSSDSGKDKVLTIGTMSLPFVPMVYKEKGELVGFDIDIAKAVAEEAGYKYQFKEFGWEPLFAATQGKQVDFAVGSIGITDDRKQTFDLSVPYFESTHVIITKEGSDIKNALDLKGKKVGVANGSTAQASIESIVDKKDLTLYEDTPFLQLMNNDIEAMVTDNIPAGEYQKNNPNAKIQIIEDKEHFDSEFYALLFPKGSELKPELDKAITTILKNGKYNEIYKKWFGKEPNVDAVLKAAE